MLKKLSILSMTLILTGVFSNPSLASTMPKADLKQSALAIGVGPSLAGDFKLTPQVSLGASFGLPFIYPSRFGVSRYDVRVVYQFLRQGNLTLSGIFGVWGDVKAFGQFGGTTSPVGLELGLGIAYWFTPQLVGRINVVPGFGFFPFDRNDFRGFFPPAGGFELGYQFTPMLEGTIGMNGNGDLIGLKFKI